MVPDEIQAWLEEDRVLDDVTSKGVVPEGAAGRGRLVARETMTVAGLGPARDVLEAFDASASLEAETGDQVKAGDPLLEAQGPARALLGAERTVCNVIGHLSGIATRTARVVENVEQGGASCEVLATRKTTPGLRTLEHDAVRAGGAGVHRSELASSVLVKENHLAFVTIEEAVEAASKHAPEAFVMVEAESVDQASTVARTDADGVLLDNFGAEEVEDVVELVRRLNPGLVIEASGGITVENVASYARLVDRVSLGSITHSAPSADVSMRIEPA